MAEQEIGTDEEQEVEAHGFSGGADIVEGNIGGGMHDDEEEGPEVEAHGFSGGADVVEGNISGG